MQLQPEGVVTNGRIHRGIRQAGSGAVDVEESGSGYRQQVEPAVGFVTHVYVAVIESEFEDVQVADEVVETVIDLGSDLRSTTGVGEHLRRYQVPIGDVAHDVALIIDTEGLHIIDELVASTAVSTEESEVACRRVRTNRVGSVQQVELTPRVSRRIDTYQVFDRQFDGRTVGLVRRQ